MRRLIADLLLTDERAAYIARYFPLDKRQLKQAAMSALGGPCACCGESILTMLTVDHVNGDGHLDRSGNIHKKVLRCDEPGRYQALCLNCNQAKDRGRECPHQSEARLIFWQHPAAG